MGLPVKCEYCSADTAYSVFDHDNNCEFARREAKRQIERLEKNLGTAWETDDTQKQIEKYKTFLQNGEGQ